MSAKRLTVFLELGMLLEQVIFVLSQQSHDLPSGLVFDEDRLREVLEQTAVHLLSAQHSGDPVLMLKHALQEQLRYLMRPSAIRVMHEMTRDKTGLPAAVRVLREELRMSLYEARLAAEILQALREEALTRRSYSPMLS